MGSPRVSSSSLIIGSAAVTHHAPWGSCFPPTGWRYKESEALDLVRVRVASEAQAAPIFADLVHGAAERDMHARVARAADLDFRESDHQVEQVDFARRRHMRAAANREQMRGVAPPTQAGSLFHLVDFSPMAALRCSGGRTPAAVSSMASVLARLNVPTVRR